MGDLLPGIQGRVFEDIMSSISDVNDVGTTITTFTLRFKGTSEAISSPGMENENAAIYSKL